MIKRRAKILTLEVSAFFSDLKNFLVASDDGNNFGGWSICDVTTLVRSVALKRAVTPLSVVVKAPLEGGKGLEKLEELVEIALKSDSAWL